MRTMVVHVLAGFVALATPAHAQRPADRSPGMPVVDDSAWWTGSYKPRAAEFGEVVRTSRYITLPNGPRLAVDVYLPRDLPAARRLPTILEQTRYFRSVERSDGGCTESSRAKWFAQRGYAYVIVDVRGTGASFGSRSAEFSQAEVRDGAAVVDWIIGQSWSDRRVGATGISYVGTTAEFLLQNNHPAVKAVAPQFAGYDLYSEVSFPGGVRNERFIRSWSMGNAFLDAGKTPPVGSEGARPVCAVDGAEGPALRAQAIAEHKANTSSADAQRGLVFRDDRGENGITIADRSPYRHRALIDRANVPTYVIESWNDIGYVLGGINRLLNTTNPNMRLLIGGWNHGGNFFYAPGVTTRTRPTFWIDEELLRFFDSELKGIDTGYRRDARVRYFTTGSNRWRGSDRWPGVTTRTQRWCFGSGGGLDLRCRGNTGEDRYVVRGDTVNGNETRWDTALRTAVVYADRRNEDAKALHYTTPALSAAVEVTGQPVVEVRMRTDASDGNFIAYLEEVRPDGGVYYVTEGLIRLSQSRLGRPPYRTAAPLGSHLRRDGLGDVRGRALKLRFAMLPVSHEFAAGSRIRVAIVGADGDRFADSHIGSTWTISRGGAQASSLVLPVAKRK